MADDRRLSADEVASRTFATSFRGYDPAEVRSYLARLAEALQAAEERERALATRAAEAEERAARPELDEDTLLRLLGDETARVMRSAREAAADMKANAEDSVQHILRDAHEEAKRLKAASETVLAERTAAAEAEAASVLEAANTEAAAVVEAARDNAEHALDDVRDKAKAMVVEAQAARERILADLARRRRVAHVQVEQLRAGRDRLLEAYRMVRSTLEDVTDELQRAEAEARQAADATARRLAADAPEAEPEPEVTEEEEEAAPRLVTTTIEAESPAPVTAEPSRPASVAVEERRLSSLRIIRQDESESEPEPEVVEPAAGFDVVEPPAPDEAVRVLTPDAPKADVDSVFARIRASREESVQHARQVLADEAPESESEPEPEQPVSDEDELALQARDEAVAEAESKLARKLKRSLQDEQNDVLDRLRNARGRSAEDVLPDLEQHLARHASAAIPFLRDIAPGVDVEPAARELAEHVVQPLRRQLEPALQARADDDDAAMADRVGMAYREWKGDRVERIAADAVMAAWSLAAFEAFADGTELRWVVDDQGDACPDCEDNALAGPTPKGEPYPTGQQHPPAHAGCRCLLVRAST
jgi:DivIVA domain-containing protein